jgi:peptidoglycan/LPS O-acetylase OafA/YrhL
MKRIAPITTIRFFLALWVFLSHFPYPILVEHQSRPILWVLRSVLRNSFNGPAAVIVFFVISGFCIHFPNRDRTEIHSWRAYYARRYIRILIPMGIAIAFALCLRLNLGLYVNFILWSLLCEEIYYLIYPLLLRMRDLLGWRPLLSIVWVASFAVVLWNPAAKEYHNFGPALTWIVGLPCWLLGARMAERLEIFSSRYVETREIWLWRCGVWSLSLVFSALRFHTSIGFPWTLNLFGVIAALWLEREIRYFHRREIPSIFEKMGEASYSVYLTHMHGSVLTGMIFEVYTPLFWWLNLAITGFIATAFYLCIERPSHQLAHTLSKRVIRHEQRSAFVDPQKIGEQSSGLTSLECGKSSLSQR